ncbi:MAG: cation:proton antiporter [Euryarchaeota archaeon]|nr:cation:proton antiporter [Euryarchaeota archaeon]
MLIELALALILVKIMDELFMRAKQPPVIGEILVGIAFSFVAFVLPSEFSFVDYNFSLNFDIYHPAFDFFADMGIIFLLFLSGMETRLSDFKKSGRSALFTGAFGVLVTFGLGFGFAMYAVGFTPTQAMVFGTIFTATSVGVTVRAMMDMNILNTDVGNTILAAAVADDIFGIILVTVVLSQGEIIELLVGISAFFIVLYLLAKYGIIERIMNAADRFLHVPYGLVSVTVGIMLLFAFFAQMAHIAMITGAFFAGLFVGQSTQERRIIGPLKAIAYAIFIPIFFVKVGILVDFNLLGNFNVILLGALPLVFLGKIIGCSLGARAAGMPRSSAVKVGVGMTPEMEVALVIASLAYGSGIFSPAEGSAIIATTIIYVILSSILTPIMLKKMYGVRTQNSVPG